MPFRLAMTAGTAGCSRNGPKAAAIACRRSPQIRTQRSAVVALHDFTFGGQPIFRLTTRTGFALL